MTNAFMKSLAALVLAATLADAEALVRLAAAREVATAG